MKRSDAKMLVALLQAYFPARELPTSTVEVWTAELVPFRADAGERAIRALGRGSQFPPSLSEVLAVVRAEQGALVAEDRAALPAAVDEPIDPGKVHDLRERLRERAARAAEVLEEWPRTVAEEPDPDDPVAVVRHREQVDRQRRALEERMTDEERGALKAAAEEGA